MHRQFIKWPSSGWLKLQKELYNYYKILIRGGRDLVYKSRACVQTGGGKLETFINHVGMVCPLCWLEGLGLATLVSGGVTVVGCCGRGHPELKQMAAVGMCYCGRGPYPARW
jgi:hypothetical protein